jgi:NACHT domain
VDEISTDVSSKPHNRVIYVARWLAKKQITILVLIFSVILNIVAALAFFGWPWSKSKSIETNSPLEWVLNNPLIFLLCTIIVLLLASIITLISKLQNTPSASEMKQRYLSRLIQENERLILSGIPAGLLAQSVPLDEVFILPQLRPNRPLTDYPLTEEHLANLRENLRRGKISEDIQQILIEAEKNWHYLTPQDRVSTIEFWHHLTKKAPAAVIQGYPGMGKSTLLARLTLHMSRRSLGHPDPLMDIILDTPCIPIFIRLSAYATECEHIKEVTNNTHFLLLDYLKQTLMRLRIPGVEQWILSQLANGHCLILLDGLDEVSNLETRHQVQEAIATFIHDYQDQIHPDFNRFIITSRVAGYDQAAFPDYPHYMIAELTSEQIDGFLPRWCRVSIRQDRNIINNVEKKYRETIITAAEQMANRLKLAVKDQSGIRELAENPLLLTLLAVMQQNSIELPRQRVELYTVVTRTLLENRNIAKGLPPIPELLAVDRLGPLAFEMQETGNSFAQQNEVISSLKQVIAEEGGTEQDVINEATSFLRRLRERGGIFVFRAGDYLGFFHRTFQEYFAARHLLHLIDNDPDNCIPDFIRRSRFKDEIWRETFLLAVAYKSIENKSVARRIVRALIDTEDKSNLDLYAHDTILAAECVIESKLLSLGAELERDIVTQLLKIYREALRLRKFSMCEQIESTVHRWLLGLHKEAYYPPILTVIRDTIFQAEELQRRSVLVLILMIVDRIESCQPVVFDYLLPPLLMLTNLPPLRDDVSSSNFSLVPDPVSTMLSLSLLSLMGKNGPGRTLLNNIRQQLRDHPDQLRYLAFNALESHTLFLPMVPPKREEDYQRYVVKLDEWLAFNTSNNATSEEKVSFCMTLFNSLLDQIEEIDYPSMIHFIPILDLSHLDSEDSCRDVWQSYLEHQIELSTIELYQDVAFLWIALFPTDMKKLVELVEKHMDEEETTHRYAAQAFLIMLGYHLQYRQSGQMSENSLSFSTEQDALMLQAKQDLQVQIEEQTKLIEKFKRASQARKAPKIARDHIAFLLEDAQLIRQNLQIQLDKLDRQNLQIQSKQLSPQDLRDIYHHNPSRIMRFPQSLQNQRILQTLQDNTHYSSNMYAGLIKNQGNSNLLDICNALFTRKISEKSIYMLEQLKEKKTREKREIMDVIFILYGRSIRIRNTKNLEAVSFDQEIQQIIRAIFESLIFLPQKDHEIGLRIVRMLKTL